MRNMREHCVFMSGETAELRNKVKIVREYLSFPDV